MSLETDSTDQSDGGAYSLVAFGIEHTPLGSTSIKLMNDMVVTNSVNGDVLSGLGFNLIESSSFNVRFEPIHIKPQGHLEVNLVRSDQSELATILHKQTQAGTEISLMLGDLLSQLVDESITVVTYENGIETSNFAMLAARQMNIGLVTRTAGLDEDEDEDDDWVKSYHLECNEYGCIVMVDPDNTSIAFDASPEKNVPFQYLGFKFDFKEAIDASTAIASLELAGRNIGPINIYSEDTLPVRFD